MTTIACTLPDDDRETNRRRWQALAARALLAVDTTDCGLRMTFATKPAVDQELRALVELERECCAFATWTVAADRGHLVLDVAGKTGAAVPAVKEMFRSLRA